MPHDSAYSCPLFVTDEDVRRIEAAWAVDVMADAVRAHVDGRLTAPTRVSADVGLASLGATSDASASPGRIVMTAGRTREWFGYRLYDTIDTARGQQVVIAHDGVTGDVAALAIGSELGAYRTGALGGLAMRELVRPGLRAQEVGDAVAGGGSQPVRIAVIGAGRQAWTQVWAAAAVLDIADVRVVSRTRASVEAFCERASRELGIVCTSVASARDAVRDADVVVLATSSSTPVIDTAWLEPDCVVVTLGPKQVGRSEFGADLLDGAFVTTDSLAQLHAYDPPALAAEHSAAGGVVSLGDVIAGRVELPIIGRRVHLSVGLAGTEVALLAAMAARDTAAVSPLPRCDVGEDLRPGNE